MNKWERIFLRAAEVVREIAEHADTGEDWQAYRHYEDLWILDFKPSIPGRETVSDPREMKVYEDSSEIEQPADVSCHAAQSIHMAVWQPRIALMVATIFEAWASIVRVDADLVYRVGGTETLGLAKQFLSKQELEEIQRNT